MGHCWTEQQFCSFGPTNKKTSQKNHLHFLKLTAKTLKIGHLKRKISFSNHWFSELLLSTWIPGGLLIYRNAPQMKMMNELLGVCPAHHFPSTPCEQCSKPWLVVLYIKDYTTHTYMGIVISQYKDHERIRTQWNVIYKGFERCWCVRCPKAFANPEFISNDHKPACRS